jgi:hypothetical protein
MLLLSKATGWVCAEAEALMPARAGNAGSKAEVSDFIVTEVI